MAEKKGQHLVPACYLRSFITDIEDVIKLNPKAEAGVYVNSKTLDAGWKMRGVNHKVFKESYYYNLPEDDPSNPYIENYLASVESSFRKNVQKVKEQQIDNEVMSFLSYFMTLQYIRTKKFITGTQGTLDQVAKCCDDFSGGEEYKKLFANIVKKQIPTSDLGGIPHPNARIIYNNTRSLFITSDNPVIRMNMNKTDLSKVIPNSLINQEIPDSQESVFFFYPLTPSIAYVSCELLQSGKVIDFDDSHLINILYLNYRSILNAYNNVYSSVKEPIKGEAELSHYLKSEKNVTYIKIYTENNRLISKGKVTVSDGNTLSFICDVSSELLKLKLGEKVSLAEVFENGCNIIGMRHCSIHEIDRNAGLVVIKSDLKLRI